MVEASTNGSGPQKFTAAHRGDSIQVNHNWPTKQSGYKLDIVIGIGNFGLVWKAKCVEGLH